MKRILLFILVLLTSLTYANAIVNTTSDVVYYTADNTFLDSTDRGNDGTNSGTTFTPGIINDAFEFEDTNDFVDSGLVDSDLSLSLSISYWFESVNPSKGQNQYIFGSTAGGAADSPRTRIRSTGELDFFMRGTTTTVGNEDILGGSIAANTTYHVVHTYDGSTMRTYVNGVLEDTTVGTTGPFAAGWATIYIGTFNGATTQDLEGWVDEFYITNYTMTLDNVTDLYNSGAGLQFPFTAAPAGDITFLNITGNNVTLNDTTLNAFNVTLIDFFTLLNVSAGSNLTNHSYNLDGAGFIQYSTDSLFGNVTLNLSNGLHNITFFAENNATNVTSATYNLLVDTDPPTLNVTLPAEYNFYDGFNFSQYIEVLDNVSAIAACIVFISNETNSNCFEEDYNFTTNGNKTINIIAVDEANNSAFSLNNTLLVNPFQFFSVKDQNGINLTNFTFGGRLDNNGTVNYTVYNDGLILGNNTLEFMKLGYVRENFSFIINLTSALDITFTVNTSQIVINLFDRVTGDPLVGPNVTLNLVPPSGGVGQTNSTTTGSLIMSNPSFIIGTYQLFATSPGYETESVIFDYNGEEIINANMFLINSSLANLGSINIIVKSNDATFVEGAIVKLLEYDAGQDGFFTASETTSNANGDAFLNIELGTKLYKFQATKDGVTTITNQEIITVDNDFRLLVLNLVTDDGPFPFDDLLFNITLTNVSTTQANVLFQWTSTNNNAYTGTISFYERIGSVRVNKVSPDVSITSSSAILQSGLFDTNNSFTLEVVVSMEIDGKVEEFQSFIFPATTSIATSLKTYGLDVIIPIALYMLGMALGLALRQENLAAILKVVFVWSSLLIVPGVLASTTAAVLTVFALGELIGGNRRR